MAKRNKGAAVGQGGSEQQALFDVTRWPVSDSVEERSLYYLLSPDGTRAVKVCREFGVAWFLIDEGSLWPYLFSDKAEATRWGVQLGRPFEVRRYTYGEHWG